MKPFPVRHPPRTKRRICFDRESEKTGSWTISRDSLVNLFVGDGFRELGARFRHLHSQGPTIRAQSVIIYSAPVCRRERLR